MKTLVFGVVLSVSCMQIAFASPPAAQVKDSKDKDAKFALANSIREDANFKKLVAAARKCFASPTKDCVGTVLSPEIWFEARAFSGASSACQQEKKHQVKVDRFFDCVKGGDIWKRALTCVSADEKDLRVLAEPKVWKVLPQANLLGDGIICVVSKKESEWRIGKLVPTRN